MQKVFGVTGWKNSGKTTLIVALIEEFARRGLRVSTIKHAHHAFDIDVRGKDSHRHRMAGAGEVLVASDTRWALLHELKAEERPSLADLLSHLAPCDLVLVEGFKGDAHPKIEVVRGDGANRLIADGDRSILAVATDRPDAVVGHPTLALDETEAIADFILRACDSKAPLSWINADRNPGRDPNVHANAGLHRADLSG